MKEYGWHIILAILIVGSTAVLMNTQKSGGIGYPVAQRDTLSVAGSSDLDVAPDEAEITLAVETQGENAKKAQDTNAQISDQVIAALAAKGVKKDDIDTTGYFLYKREGYDPKTGKPFSLGYQQTHTMKVVVKDVEDSGDVIDAATDAGATSIQDIRFTLSHEKQQKSNAQALAFAVDNAREKAKTLADASDVTLGDIITISESNYNMVPPRPYYDVMDVGSAMARTEVLPQDVTLTLTVNVVFEIR